MTCIWLFLRIDAVTVSAFIVTKINLNLSQVYLPVFVEGGKLSVGDMHFSQGDGEVSFCGAPASCAGASVQWRRSTRQDC